MAPSDDPVIGMDVGATAISAGLVDRDGAVLLTLQTPTGSPGTTTATILSLFDRLLAGARERGLRVAGVGVGLPGLVDVEGGAMRPIEGGWMSGLDDVPLARLLEERSGLDVFVDNDVNALVLAEWTWGLGRGASSLVTIAIGTGIGGGLVVNRALLRGARDTAGEIGHMAVNLEGPICPCGGVGCLTTYLSGRLIADRARERLAAHPDSAVLARAGGDPSRISAEIIFAEAAAGDPLARAVVDQGCEALAMAIGALANLLSPEAILITGGVARSLAPLRDDLVRRARRRMLAAVFAATAIHVAPADKGHTVRGGAALVFYEMGRRQPARARRAGSPSG